MTKMQFPIFSLFQVQMNYCSDGNKLCLLTFLGRNMTKVTKNHQAQIGKAKNSSIYNLFKMAAKTLHNDTLFSLQIVEKQFKLVTIFDLSYVFWIVVFIFNKQSKFKGRLISLKMKNLEKLATQILKKMPFFLFMKPKSCVDKYLSFLSISFGSLMVVEHKTHQEQIQYDLYNSQFNLFKMAAVKNSTIFKIPLKCT